MFERPLPIGSVVLLQNSTKRVMIIGFCQRQADEPDSLWDYAGCMFPEGYLSPDKTFLFNHDQIDKVYALGYQDEEQFSVQEKVTAFLRQREETGEKPE